MLTSLPVMAAEEAKKPHHPQKDMQLHAEFYSKWKKANGESCCNDADCYPTLARFNKQTGLWEALRREDQVWITIPKFVYDNSDPGRPESPDGKAHLCAPNPGDLDMDEKRKGVRVYCFRAPGFDI